MFFLYVSKHCRSKRRIMKDFQEQNIKYVYQDMNETPLSYEQFIDILKGCHDIYQVVSIDSKSMQALEQRSIDFESLTLKQLYEYVLEDVKILKSPILYNSDKEITLTGYSHETMGTLIPKQKRQTELSYFLDALRYEEDQKEKVL